MAFQCDGTMSKRSLSVLRPEIVVGAWMTLGVVERLRRNLYLTSETVEDLKSLWAEIVTQKVTPPPTFGLKQPVDPDGHVTT